MKLAPVPGADKASTFKASSTPGHASYAKSLVPPSGDEAAYIAFDQGQYLTALKLAEEGVKRNDPQSHTLLGRLYAEGLGVSKEPETAAKWYARGDELGDIQATFALGVLYAEGRGVKKDRSKSAELFEKAARTGHPLANYNLGLLFLKGDGKPQNPYRAADAHPLRGREGHRCRAIRSRRPLPERRRRRAKCARGGALAEQSRRAGHGRGAVRLRRGAAARPGPHAR